MDEGGVFVKVSCDDIPTKRVDRSHSRRIKKERMAKIKR